MRRPRRPSLVRQANEQVPITLACALVGMDIGERVEHGRSTKVDCPFGEIYHADQGLEAAFRIYPDSNTAYCFACATHFTPVKLVAQAWDAPYRQVARELLERVGARPPTLADAWAAASATTVRPDPAHLAEALKTFCARTDPGWADAQFDPGVATTLSGCLHLLDRVVDPDGAALWLAGCKTVMTRALDCLRMSSTPVDSR